MGGEVGISVHHQTLFILHFPNSLFPLVLIQTFGTFSLTFLTEESIPVFFTDGYLGST